MSVAKKKGTTFETAVVKALRAGLEDDRVERRALHGNKDMGDIYGIYAHAFHAIAECKAHKRITPGLIAEWRSQTVIERGNADADIGMLIVKVYRAPILQSQVHVTTADYLRLAGQTSVSGEWAESRWVQITLEEAIDLIRFGIGKDESND
ncbi:hypothetical protein K6V98_08180 [Collinsella sp. AGMB00827]|uniref:Uncharacterized protein n=1 Tax=Collinsella ureilytica TaxID=2869515 RepID=A0ABS7MMP3_9ACTN|nr:hypothetical protein [Collinsella urealyticum]MBY4798321.1 hypothetical protein [Collinsella urealyticum]